jgi:DNA-binding transcriptional MerR regulator
MSRLAEDSPETPRRGRSDKGRRAKSADAFRTISEVADDLKLPQHVLRFWETRFNQIKPMKRGGGRRYYRPDDVDLLRGIRTLLYSEGYTIRGVQRLLKEQGNKFAVQIGRGEKPVVESPLPDLNAGEDLPPAKTAVDVAELEKPSGGKGKRIIERLTGRGDDGNAGSSGIVIGADDRRNLQATLYELLECKRLLDQTRQG